MKSKVFRKKSLTAFDNLQDGPGMRVSRTFSEDLASNFVELSEKYFEVTGDVPYAYRERQVSSFVVSAIAKTADVVFTEIPTRRGVGKESSHGWIDFWAIHRNATLLIELKHCYSSVRKLEKVQKAVSGRWISAVDQLKAVKKGEFEDLQYGSRLLLKVPMVIVTHVTYSKYRDGLIDVLDESTLYSRHITLLDGLKPSPDWSVLWSPEQEMRGPYELQDGWESYHGVSIFLGFESCNS